MNNLLSLKKNLLIAVLLDLTLLLLVLKLLMKVSLARTMLGSFFGLYILNEEQRPIALKAKKESSDDETSTSGSDDEEYAMAVRNLKSSLEERVNFLGNQEKKRSYSDKRIRRKERVTKNVLDAVIQIISLAIVQNHLATKIKRPSLEVLGVIAKIMPKNDETCLMAQSSNEVCLRTCLEPDEWIKDSGCSKHMTGNKSLLSTYKAYDGGNVGFGSNLKGKIIGKGRKIQNQLGSSIIAIRMDHGWEFDNEVQFGAYCDAQGITHNFSTSCTPQSNRVVEKKNRTLQEMSRTMLNEQTIPQKFWCNAVDTSTYILNRILIRPIGKTPYEIFRGRKPSLEYFKVFRSKYFILNTKDYLTKFNPKSYEGVFLGYSQNSKAYVVLNKHSMKVKESLNMTFDESLPPTKLSPLVDVMMVKKKPLKRIPK
ncbi:retrovirus-related pol polyprotein from transposon TNT 1-94 [Tanacetum coccineum]